MNILCECGCGREVNPPERPSRPNRFLKGHRSKLKKKTLKECSFCHKEKYKRIRGLCPSCYSRERWRRIPSKDRRSVTSSNRRRWKEIKEKLFTGLGNKCACCGEHNKEFLCLDHIQGNGSEERRKLGGNISIYRKVIKENFPKDQYQLLCWNCNASMGHYGYCPHGNLPLRIPKSGSGEHHVGIFRTSSANWENRKSSK